MRIVIVGASGQLGSELMRAYADQEAIGVDRSLFDIESSPAVSKMLTRYRPDVVFNTAAFHNVELCETRPDRALAVNALAVDQLAAQCAAAGVALAHVSTDYVFDGRATQPYAEADGTNPLNAYGISKLAGEFFIRRQIEQAYIFRTAGLYGVQGRTTKGPTFIERILKQAREGKPISVVGDVTSSPSYVRHVASTMRAVIETGAFGTYHVANAGACSWYDFAVEALRQTGSSASVKKITAAESPSLARRPAYSALASTGLKRLGVLLPPTWQQGIEVYLKDRETAGIAAQISRET